MRGKMKPNKVLFTIFPALLCLPSYAGDNSAKAAAMAGWLHDSPCSLKESKWCATDAKGTEQGFLVNATAKSLRYLELNYENFTAACMLWKASGGEPDAVASILITDESGREFFMSRRCQYPADSNSQ